jgi:hypothetical protein
MEEVQNDDDDGKTSIEEQKKVEEKLEDKED